jgi:multidrug efflux pump subunit AcrA (membrane-fusion protein)
MKRHSHFVLIAALTSFCLHALAGPGEPGHSHGEGETPFQGANAPKRFADGSVYLPKIAQRQLGIRTALVQVGEFPRTIELSGKVIHNPNYGGKVQAMVTGRITPPPKGFPVPGQFVKQGDLLAYVTPEIGPANTRSLAESRLKRLQALSDTVPRKVLEEAQAAVANEELRAPVSGMVATTGVVSGQVVEARQLIFEIVNPNKFMVEAVAYEPSVLDNIGSANLSIGDQIIPLKLQGAAKRLREQALPITFLADDEGLSQLAIGQVLRVYVQTKQTIKGFRIPTSAVVRDGSNQSVVWIKEGPQLFRPITVAPEPLNGSDSLVQGLHENDRVASKSASLLNQIR